MHRADDGDSDEESHQRQLDQDAIVDKMDEAFSHMESDLSAAAAATYVSDQASLAAAEGAAQQNRHSVLRLRSLSIEALNKVPPDRYGSKGGKKVKVPHALARQSQRLPVVPSSLFGGRLFTGYRSVHKKKQTQKVFKRMVSEAGGTVPPEPAFNNKEGKQPFRDQKPKQGNSARRRGRNGGAKAGAAGQGKGAKQAKTQQQQQQQNTKAQATTSSSNQNQRSENRRKRAARKSKKSKPKDDN